MQYDALEYLKDELGFDFLSDVTCVDLLAISRRRRPVSASPTNLSTTDTNERLTVLVMLNEPDLAVRSAVPLWEGANWLEREVYDMFGITFEGHPDLRRILLPEEFTAFPLRKDYPLQGRGERHNFPVGSRRAEG